MAESDSEPSAHPANLIRLADRWRRAGAAMRRKDVKRFVRHLLALEEGCILARDNPPARRGRLI